MDNTRVKVLTGEVILRKTGFGRVYLLAVTKDNRYAGELRNRDLTREVAVYDLVTEETLAFFKFCAVLIQTPENLALEDKAGARGVKKRCTDVVRFKINWYGKLVPQILIRSTQRKSFSEIETVSYDWRNVKMEDLHYVKFKLRAHPKVVA